LSSTISLPATSSGATLTQTGQVGISSSSISSLIVMLRCFDGTRGIFGSIKSLSSSTSSTASDGIILILQLLKLSGCTGSLLHLTTIEPFGPQAANRLPLASSG